MFRRRCKEIQDDLSAYVDGELTKERMQALEDHLRRCKEDPDCERCRNAVAILSAVRGRISSSQGIAPEKMESLKRSILDAIGSGDEALRLGLSSKRMRLSLAVSGALAVATVLGFLKLSGFFFADPMVAYAVTTFQQHIEEKASPDFGSADPGELGAYFTGKVPFEAGVYDFSSAGWRIRGGSVCGCSGIPIAHVDYHRGEEEISLFILPSQGCDVSKLGRPTSSGVRVLSHGGCFVTVWTDGRKVCMLVGKNPGEVMKLAMMAVGAATTS